MKVALKVGDDKQATGGREPEHRAGVTRPGFYVIFGRQPGCANMLWFLLACGDEVSSDEEAEYAYVGLDQMVSKALDLGLLGYAQATSANIDPQESSGAVSGTLTVSGQVDQGNSDNKGLRLNLALDEYADLEDLDEDDDEKDDDIEVVYFTDSADLPLLDLKLRDVPDGTLEGTLTGVFAMEGDLEGPVNLSLSLAGPIEDDGAGQPQRVAGQTQITGTVTNEDGGTFSVDVTR